MPDEKRRLAEDLDSFRSNIARMPPGEVATDFYMENGQELLELAENLLDKETPAGRIWTRFRNGKSATLYGELHATLDLVIQELRRGG